MKISEENLQSIRMFSNFLRQEEMKLELVKSNTLLVENGKEWVKTQEGIVRLLQNTQNQLANSATLAAGCKQGVSANIDLFTGEIKENDTGTPNTKEAN